MRYLELGHNTIMSGVADILGYRKDDPRIYDSIGDDEILKESRLYYKNVYYDIERSAYYPEVAEKILGYTPILKINQTFIRALEVSDQLDIPLYKVYSTLKYLSWDSKELDLYRCDYAQNIIFSIKTFKKVYIEYRAVDLYF